MKKLKVLSLFDGISCGMVSLCKAGIQVERYYASEIDKNAIKISKKNYPNIIQIGDICNLTDERLEELGDIDLIIGGSPCQNLSSANVYSDKKGLEGGKSKLFYEYVRVLNFFKKKNKNLLYLLENVGSATLEDRAIITEHVGNEGIFFNSELLSAQNRNRVYWSNMNFTVPNERKNLFMQDILEENVNDKYYVTEKMRDYIMSKGTGGWQSGKLEIDLKIARPLTATMHKMHRADTDNYISTEYAPQGKTNIRRLTPIECERLQTLPDNYTQGISDTQRYITIGNGWTVDVIVHILKSHFNLI